MNDTSSDNTEPEIKTCVSGQSFGYAVFMTPNITSKAFVGNAYNISWRYTENVKKMPEFITIKLQLLASKVTVDWNTIVEDRAPTTPSWYMWTPRNALDGSYKLRLVPNNKETFIPPSEQLTKKQPCFEDGEAVPSVSSAFRLINPKTSIDSGTSVNPFAPSNGNGQSSLHHPVIGPLFLVFLIWLFLQH